MFVYCFLFYLLGNFGHDPIEQIRIMTWYNKYINIFYPSRTNGDPKPKGQSCYILASEMTCNFGSATSASAVSSVFSWDAGPTGNAHPSPEGFGSDPDLSEVEPELFTCSSTGSCLSPGLFWPEAVATLRPWGHRTRTKDFGVLTHERTGGTGSKRHRG